jgi:hypothetical protein
MSLQYTEKVGSIDRTLLDKLKQVQDIKLANTRSHYRVLVSMQSH